MDTATKPFDIGFAVTKMKTANGVWEVRNHQESDRKLT